ncbi:MAG: hypothetical protein IPG68_13325 [Micrococcales bacterium]|nr:hypothetical protein [Micrococcales bacterium]
MDTGHDLEQERIPAALGGYLSCLELADVASPAVLEWFTLEQRLVARPIRATQSRGPWHPAKKAQCCARRGYKTAQDAAAHARDPKHVALTHGAHAWQVVALCRGFAPEPAPEMPGEPWTAMWEWDAPGRGRPDQPGDRRRRPVAGAVLPRCDGAQP